MIFRLGGKLCHKKWKMDTGLPLFKHSFLLSLYDIFYSIFKTFYDIFSVFYEIYDKIDLRIAR